jgi:hypothetical protein
MSRPTHGGNVPRSACHGGDYERHLATNEDIDRRAPVAITHQVVGRNHIEVILVTERAVGTKLQARTLIVSFAVGDPALMRNKPTMRRTSMIKLKLLAATAILSLVLANPALAQAVIQESGVYAKNVANADLGIGSLPPSRGAIGTANVKTTVWPAPVGHRQPRAADIPSLGSGRKASLSLDQEDAAVDRKIYSICRGC